jgi:arginine decarboxylase
MLMSAQRVWSASTPAYDVQEQTTTPYADAVRRYVESEHVTFMVPGHNESITGGARALDRFFGGNLVRYDVPVMIDGIDLGPQSPLVESRKLAAKAWGADTAWFLTNGASQANRTAALAVRGLGKHVMMQRSSHSSFIDGVLAAGLQPSFVFPNIDQQNGAAHGISPAMLDQALRTAPEPVSSVYTVSPSYFGATADIAGLAEVAHRHHAALIVDCAWGAHFGFHEQLPESPSRLGADLVISSTHKLAGSLTQSAMLLLGNGAYAERLRPLVDRAFMMTASTSMSAVLLASLDLARSAIATGYEEIGESIELAEKLRDRLRADNRFRVLDDTFGQYTDIAAIDPLRVAIDISQLGVTGHWVSGELEKRGVYVEMATVTTIVAVIGAGAFPDIDVLYRTLDEIAVTARKRQERDERLPNPSNEFPDMPAAGELTMLPRDAFFAETELVSAADAAGRISADSLAAYPPGIPNVIPGEKITSEVVDFLSAVAQSPTGYVRGASDPLVEHYRVLADRG